MRGIMINNVFEITNHSKTLKHEHGVDKVEVEDRQFKGFMFEMTQYKFVKPKQIYDEAAGRPE